MKNNVFYKNQNNLLNRYSGSLVLQKSKKLFVRKPCKAQITLFFILGLIILIIIALLFMLKSSLEPKQTGIKTILHELEVGRVKNYVVDCISDLSKDAIREVGANGGFIYDFQGGAIPFEQRRLGEHYLNYTFLGRTYFVNYGLKKNSACDVINYSSEGYPYPGASFRELVSLYQNSEPCMYGSESSIYDGFFGQNVMAKLCYVTRETGCEGFGKGNYLGLTIQKQIEDYVTARLPGCVNFSAFAERMGVVDITPEAPPSVLVDIHPSQIIVVVNYPVKIIFENQDPIIQVLKYQAVLNNRFGGLYNFAYHVLSRDSQGIDWDVKRYYVSSHYWLPGFRLSKIINPCSECPFPYNLDSIIEFSDAQSLINGRPLIFRVAIENRRPAIDFIPNQSFDISEGRISIPFVAYDPDDEPLRYYFLSFSPGRNGLIECSGDEPFSPSSDSLLTGVAGSHLGGAKGWCEKDQRILNSLPYSLIWAPINDFDVGKHEVALLAIDESGLFDYQAFMINITRERNEPLLQACYQACQVPDLGMGLNDEECQEICLITANDCVEYCHGYFYRYYESSNDPAEPLRIIVDDNCKACVDDILRSPPRYSHNDCSFYSNKEECISNMPDCFWVLENKTIADGSQWSEKCFNDYELGSINQPAYIIES